jgi:CRP/FNR family cyclic AMP-dependent transcriptional regulator
MVKPEDASKLLSIPGGLTRPTVEMLREIRLLKSFDEHQLSTLIDLGAPAAYEAHGNIVIEGELSWGLYFILSGKVGIFKTNKLSGDIYDVGQLKAGNFFGEMSLVDDNPRSATVKALTDCQLFYISKDAFMQYLDSSHELKILFYESCVQTLVHRLRELDDNYVISQYQLWRSVMKKEAA